ncbi:MAG: rhomboid family intramembrane serine protease [Bacteroidales bacterium]|nr:rhomboid family intramembrane serine protease [Bacteroidales bacterium]
MPSAVSFFFAVAALWVYTFTDGCGYTVASGVLPRAASVLSHATLFHWAANMAGIASMFASLSKAVHPLRLLVVAFTAAVAATYAAQGETPTMGASGMLFFLAGADIVLRWAGIYFRIDPVRMLVYTCTVVTFIALTVLIPGINGRLHLVAFTAGILYGLYGLLRIYRRK